MTFNIEVLKSNCCRYVTKNSTSLLLSLPKLLTGSPRRQYHSAEYSL